MTEQQGAQNESTHLGKKSVSQLQDHPAQACRAHYLQGPASQAAPGINTSPAQILRMPN
jgi:hypothetical protein